MRFHSRIVVYYEVNLKIFIFSRIYEYKVCTILVKLKTKNNSDHPEEMKIKIDINNQNI